jgi:hypothetical protein
MTEIRQRWEHAVAGVISIAFTASIGALFLRPIEIQRAGAVEEDVIEVIFIDRAPDGGLPITRTSTALAPPVPAGSSLGRRRADLARPVPVPERMEDAERVNSAKSQVPVAIDLSVARDAWSKTGNGSPFRSSEDRLAGRPVPEVVAHVDHLHVKMKTPITVETVLQEVGKTLGFWPPGYTDDPCPGIVRLADYYRAHPPSRSDLLNDALDLESKCKKASPST